MKLSNYLPIIDAFYIIRCGFHTPAVIYFFSHGEKISWASKSVDIKQDHNDILISFIVLQPEIIEINNLITIKNTEFNLIFVLLDIPFVKTMLYVRS